MPGDGAAGRFLVLNTGSSSIRFALFDDYLDARLSGLAAGIGTGRARLRVAGTDREAALPDHPSALAAIFAVLEAKGIAPDRLAAAGHRIVHGGALTEPARITDETRAEIAAAIPLAPLHNPHNLAAIEAVAALAPELPQFASFDTAFHATIPPVAARYAIPAELSERGIRRYGFHGISYAGLVARFAVVTGQGLPRRLLALHLGNGASIAAIRDGVSQATTMGYSPLEGLTMGTRAGGIDANAVLRLAENLGIDRTRQILNHESGLLGLSGGTSDMARLLADDSPDAAFAVEHFCYWAARHAASLLAALGGVDAIAFTGGIGENAAPVRARILAHLEWLGLALDARANAANATRLHKADSAVSLWIVPAREEWTIARDAQWLMGAA